MDATTRQAMEAIHGYQLRPRRLMVGESVLDPYTGEPTPFLGYRDHPRGFGQEMVSIPGLCGEYYLQRSPVSHRYGFKGDEYTSFWSRLDTFYRGRESGWFFVTFADGDGWYRGVKFPRTQQGETITPPVLPQEAA